MMRLAVVLSIALGADNPDPVRNQYDQFRWKQPQYFDQTLNAGFIDAGDITVSGNINSPAAVVTVATLDAGQAYIQNQLGLGGPLRGDSVAARFATIDAGQVYVQNQFEVGGTSVLLGTVNGASVAAQFATIDAGQMYVQNQLNVTGYPATISDPIDAGVEQARIEYGWALMSTGAVTVTFAHAFSAKPMCNCTHLNTTNSNPCVVTAAPSTTQLAMAVTSGGSDQLFWMCIGAK